jgi:hypothetical protein
VLHIGVMTRRNSYLCGKSAVVSIPCDDSLPV